MEAQGTLLSAGQLAERLGVSRGSIYKMVAAGVLPVIAVGAGRGAIRFDYAAVMQALTKQAHTPRPYHPPKCEPAAILA